MVTSYAFRSWIGSVRLGPIQPRLLGNRLRAAGLGYSIPERKDRMEKLTDVLKRMPASLEVVTTEKRSSTSSRGPGKTPAEQVFTRLAAMYGNKLMDMYSGQDLAVVRAEWGAQIDRFSVDEVKGALDACIKDYPSWPPTLPEFVSQCRAKIRPVLLRLDSPRPKPPKGIFEKLRGQLK